MGNNIIIGLSLLGASVLLLIVGLFVKIKELRDIINRTEDKILTMHEVQIKMAKAIIQLKNK